MMYTGSSVPAKRSPVVVIFILYSTDSAITAGQEGVSSVAAVSVTASLMTSSVSSKVCGSNRLVVEDAAMDEDASVFRSSELVEVALVVLGESAASDDTVSAAN